MMDESVYRAIELVGSSPIGWEDAAKDAIDSAGTSIWKMRVAQVVEMDARLDGEKIISYRVRLRISFKYDNWKIEVGWKVPKGIAALAEETL